MALPLHGKFKLQTSVGPEYRPQPGYTTFAWVLVLTKIQVAMAMAWGNTSLYSLYHYHHGIEPEVTPRYIHAL